MAFEDLFHNQACKMDLYMFNDSGVFVDVISHEMAEATFSKDFRILLPKGLPYPLHFVAWSGIHNETCQVTEMRPGLSTRNDLVVALKEYPNNTFDQSLKGLWHGTATKTEENLTIAEEETVIFLTKNTNSLRVILQVLDDENEVLEIDDFTFSLQCVNGSYDHLNNVKDNYEWTYIPFHVDNDPEVGGIAEIHTMRLLEDSKNILSITYTPLSSTVIDLDLTRYINALKLQLYGNMPLQEYMDREDEYRVIVFLKYLNDAWFATDVIINEWYLRDQEE